MSEYIIDWDTSLVIDTFSKNNLREEIVRCRDCVHYKIVDEIYFGDGEVEEIFGCAKFDMLEGSDPLGFCAWGRRMVDA